MKHRCQNLITLGLEIYCWISKELWVVNVFVFGRNACSKCEAKTEAFSTPSHLEHVFRPNSNTLTTDNSLDIQQYISECYQMEIPIRKLKQHEIVGILANIGLKRQLVPTLLPQNF